jgi:leucyl/phenylalanyl-tRNA--protein transferase
VTGAVSHYPDWESFDPASFPHDAPVAFCADLGAESVLGAYRRGIVPMPAADEYFRTVNEIRYADLVMAGTIGIVGDDREDPYWVAWWSPDPRPVIGVGEVHLGRDVRRRLRRDGMVTTANAAFRRAAEECRASREPRWLTDPLLDALIELHSTGWAHSVEVWQDGRLAGGAIGIGIGRVISGDSLFSRASGAGRIAVADMARRLDQAGGLVVDAQWDSPFLRSLGAEPIRRERYLTVLAQSGKRIALPPDPLAARLLINADLA